MFSTPEFPAPGIIVLRSQILSGVTDATEGIGAGVCCREYCQLHQLRHDFQPLRLRDHPGRQSS
jgi:hypothetical protein